MAKSIFIVAGEESGDKHASALMTELSVLFPEVSFYGMGGDAMRRAGLKGLDSRAVSVVGIIEVAEKIRGIIKTFKELKRMLNERAYDAIVLVDLPDFNLRFAKAAKKLGIPIIYYISPQVWAWRQGRVKTIASLVDRMLVVFPFEVDIYRNAGVDVEYVGHPLADRVKCDISKDAARALFGIDAKRPCVALLPGSRTGEIKRLFPMMLEAAALIGARVFEKSAVRPVFVVPVADSLDDGFIEGFIKPSLRDIIDVRFVRSRMYEALRAADAALVTSGTATLETALIATPMVIVYRLNSFTAAIARMLISVKHVGLPNIIAGRPVVPELLQDEATPHRAADEILELLFNKDRSAGMQKELVDLRGLIGSGGSARNAAVAIKKMIEKG